MNCARQRTNPKRMKIVTFNAGLLSISLPGGFKKFEPAAWVEERLARMPQALLDVQPDVLLLQEVYSQKHKQWLAQALSGWLPHAAFGGAAPWYRLLPDSLMLLSRYPIDHSGFVRFEAGRWDERLLDTKGFYVARLNETPLGPLLIANLHTTAGVFTHPEHQKIDRVRNLQIHQALRHLAQKAGDAKIVLGGDLNCGPGVSFADEPDIVPLVLRGLQVPAAERVSLHNYRLITEYGLRDTHHTLGLAERPTWSPTSNPLNRGGEHAAWGCPAQRIDHVFVKPDQLVPTAAGVFLEDAVVPVSDTTSVPLSDHYGYWVELTST